MKTHQPKDPKSNLSCNVCDKTFARSFTLSRHLEPVHSTRISTETNIFLLKKLKLLKKNGVSITNKAYIVFEHLIPVIEQKKQGLGEWSEEVVEACHQKF